MQKRRISTFDTHELTGATSRTDAVDRRLPVHQERSVGRNGICVGEHRQEVCR